MGWWRKKKKPKSEIESKRGADLLEELIKCCDGKSNPIKFFSANEIREATENFSESNYVSELSDLGYKWYLGKNENHHKILIKKADDGLYNFPQGHLCRDIAISSMVSGHKNFLKLVGCCLEVECLVMVYHVVKKHYKLDDISEQPWKRRLKIAEDIVTALAYLHTAFPRPFVYRTLSLENILLDEDGVAKLRDFSFCVSIPKGETFVRVDKVVGTYNYFDDKFMRSGVVSEETDVFAIGMFMILKLLTGEKSFFEFYREEKEKEELKGYGTDYESMKRRGLHNWLSKLKEHPRMEEIAEPKMLEDMVEISKEELCQMKAFLMLSLRCMGHKGEEVPKIVEVAKELKKIQRSLKNDSSSSPSGETKLD